MDREVLLLLRRFDEVLEINGRQIKMTFSEMRRDRIGVRRRV